MESSYSTRHWRGEMRRENPRFRVHVTSTKALAARYSARTRKYSDNGRNSGTSNVKQGVNQSVDFCNGLCSSNPTGTNKHVRLELLNTSTCSDISVLTAMSTHCYPPQSSPSAASCPLRSHFMGNTAPPKGPTQGRCFTHPQLLHLAATLVAFARMRVALMMIPGTFDTVVCTATKQQPRQVGGYSCSRNRTRTDATGDL